MIKLEKLFKSQNPSELKEKIVGFTFEDIFVRSNLLDTKPVLIKVLEKYLIFIYINFEMYNLKK